LIPYLERGLNLCLLLLNVLRWQNEGKLIQSVSQALCLFSHLQGLEYSLYQVAYFVAHPDKAIPEGVHDVERSKTNARKSKATLISKWLNGSAAHFARKHNWRLASSCNLMRLASNRVSALFGAIWVGRWLWLWWWITRIVTCPFGTGSSRNCVSRTGYWSNLT